jgi:iron complex transport system permease protein
MTERPFAATPESRPSNTYRWPTLGIRRIVLLALLALLVVAFILSLTLGSVSIPVQEIITVLTGGEPTRASWRSIVLNHRLPKALTASLAGAALAVAGLQMQTLFRNPLAGPFVLGINSGASLGVALVVLTVGVAQGSALSLLASLGLAGNLGVVFAASMGSALVMGLVLLIARHVRGTVTLLILGMMIGYATGAIVSVLLYFSIAEFIQVYINWTFGSFSGVTWAKMEVFAPAIITGIAIAYVLAKPLNALLLGESYARSMGLHIRRTRFWIIASASVLAGAVTAFCGPIGFIGIAVPHLCRSLFNTSDHRILMPTVTLMGAVLALITDLIAQMPGSQTVLPLNAVTSLIGAPIVIWVILRQQSSNGTLAR